MKTKPTRRDFLKKSAAATLTAPLVLSLEEYALAAQNQPPPVPPAWPAPPQPSASLPMGNIGKVKMSRLICGGNLISGYAHSRDLIYVSSLLKHYFTEEKIMETWALSEQHGINTMIVNPEDAQASALYQKYRARGGRIQYLAQIGPAKDDLKTPVQRARDAGAVGAFLLGNLGDAWTRDGDVKLIGELISLIKEQGLIAGVAGHELRTVMTVEKAGCAPDFYMKTLHDTNYWCMDPKETIAYMSELRRPWIAYKVLAAGAISPRAGFQHAFANGADFVAVGMFDFQVAEDASILPAIVQANQNRDREWFA